MRKKVLWILGSFLLLLAILVGFFHTSFVKAKVLKYVQETLAQSFNLSLSAQSLDYNLFTLRISLEKPIIGTHDNSTLPPFFQADELVLRLTPALILGKKIDIRDILVKKVPGEIFHQNKRVFKKKREKTYLAPSVYCSSSLT